MSERQNERDRMRETDGQADRQTNTQRDRQTNTHTDVETKELRVSFVLENNKSGIITFRKDERAKKAEGERECFIASTKREVS